MANAEAQQQIDGSDVLGQLAKAASQKRPIFKYKIPKASGEGDFTQVGLVRLTVREEVAVGDSTLGKPSARAMALAKASLVQVNGKTVTDADESKEIAWGNMPAKVRNLVLLAYNRLHIPEDKDVDDFLGSEEIQVG